MVFSDLLAMKPTYDVPEEYRVEILNVFQQLIDEETLDSAEWDIKKPEDVHCANGYELSHISSGEYIRVKRRTALGKSSLSLSVRRRLDLGGEVREFHASPNDDSLRSTMRKSVLFLWGYAI